MLIVNINLEFIKTAFVNMKDCYNQAHINEELRMKRNSIYI